MKNLLVKIVCTFAALVLINFLLERVGAHILIHIVFDAFALSYCIFEINKFYGPTNK